MAELSTFSDLDKLPVVRREVVQVFVERTGKVISDLKSNGKYVSPCPSASALPPAIAGTEWNDVLSGHEMVVGKSTGANKSPRFHVAAILDSDVNNGSAASSSNNSDDN